VLGATEHFTQLVAELLTGQAVEIEVNGVVGVHEEEEERLDELIAGPHLTVRESGGD